MIGKGNDSHHAELRRVAASLLDIDRPAYTLRNEVLDLKSLLEDASGTIAGTTSDIAAGETRTEQGLAISPTMAAMCLDDFARTVQFVRGIHDAISDLRSEITSRSIRVLYAGCGPWATLAVPVMAVLPATDVKFTLLDIHEKSTVSARKLVDRLGLSESVDAVVTTDACAYEVSQQPDIVVIEMMRAALDSEPQVAVSMHLMREAPNAIMIPESIRVALSLIDQSMCLDPEEVDDAVSPTVIEVGEILVLNKSSIEAAQRNADQFPETTMQLPDFDTDRYSPMLTTTVGVYRDRILQGNDSGITLSTLR